MIMSETAFGSTGAFGQPQQQQPANPMFGNLGTANTTTTPFGMFRVFVFSSVFAEQVDIFGS